MLHRCKVLKLEAYVVAALSWQVIGLWFTPHPPCCVQKVQSGSWDLMMRKGGVQKMVNEYFDRECERI